MARLPVTPGLNADRDAARETPVHPVEVFPAALEALLLGERFPDPVWVAARAVGPHRTDPVPRLADGERHGDVEVPVEAVALVEAADIEQDGAAARGAVALHRVDLAAGRLVEVLEVGGAQPPRARLADRGIGQRRFE